MRQIGCYKGLAESRTADAERPLSAGPRAARALAGLLFIASAGVLYIWPLALLPRLGLPDPVAWLLAIPALWLGLSHLVAATTGYRGCPEIGAIPSVLLRRRVITGCAPWERLDRRIGTGVTARDAPAR